MKIKKKQQQPIGPMPDPTSMRGQHTIPELLIPSFTGTYIVQGR